jgi:hypothetical protein
MTRPNPWGENWNNEFYSSAEMDMLLAQIFGPKCAFMGFLPAGKRKWVKSRADGTMELINLHFDRGLVFANFGLSFPWIPHGNWKQVCWHKTAKSSVLDLWYEHADIYAWSIPKGRMVAEERAKIVSTEICEACEPWFIKLTSEQNILQELERRRSSANFYSFVQGLTVYLFWQARIGKWGGLDAKSEQQMKSYFGEDGFPEFKKLLDGEVARRPS